jgi:gluconolactonase
MTLDEFGNLYLTNGGVDIYTPKDGLTATILGTGKKPPMSVFGGTGRRTLFIAARHGLYAIRMNVSGQ